MANILDEHELARLHGCAREIGLDVLFETHTREEIAKIPKDARIYGINCRSFASSETSFALSRWLGNWFGSRRDLTIDYARFDQCKDLPAHVLKVAESGVNPERIPAVRAAGYHAALVGTSLLIGPEPIEQVLRGFEEAILGMARKPAPATA
jgi:indole-3-glycerol phosphate synthase